MDLIKQLYDIIKQKRDSARLDMRAHAMKQDISDEEKSELRGEICAYNDILALMEGMGVKYESDTKND